MSLEQEWWKTQRGSSPVRTHARRPTTFDRVARVIAIVLLFAIFAVTVWALSLSKVTAYLLPAGLILFVVYLASRVHELGLELAALRSALDELRSGRAPDASVSAPSPAAPEAAPTPPPANPAPPEAPPPV